MKKENMEEEMKRNVKEFERTMQLVPGRYPLPLLGVEKNKGVKMDKIKEKLYKEISKNANEFKILKKNNLVSKRCRGMITIQRILDSKYKLFISFKKGKRKQVIWRLLKIIQQKAFLEGQRQMYERMNKK